MIVVSDTTPLISLLKINRIDLLERLFGEVLIPQAVFNELTSDERFQVEAEQLKRKEFIRMKPVNNPESADILKRATGLDQGESEAIVLSDELKADLLLMDEAKGRNVSTQMGLQIMGTIGLLMAAYEEQELTSDEIRKCIDGLQRAGRHIAETLSDAIEQVKRLNIYRHVTCKMACLSSLFGAILCGEVGA